MPASQPIPACMTLAMSPVGAGKNESAAVVIGVWPVRKYETSPPGSTSQRIEDSRRWCWLGTAQAGLQFAGTRLRSRIERVVGVVLASGAVRAETRPTDPEQLAQATRLMADGQGEDLVRDPKRSFPSFVSAATFMDIASTPPAIQRFFWSPDAQRGRHANPLSASRLLRHKRRCRNRGGFGIT